MVVHDVSGAKTLDQWNGSDKDFDNFFKVGDIVDQSVFDYLLEVVFPVSFNRDHVQCGEPSDHGGKNGAARYATIVRHRGAFVYIGDREVGDLEVRS